MNTRVDPFANLTEPPVFTTKPRVEKPVQTDIIERIAKENNFPLDERERLIAKLAILAGMRPGEIFGLTLERLAEASAEVTQRVYRGKINTRRRIIRCARRL